MQTAGITGLSSLAIRLQERQPRARALVVAAHETPETFAAEFREQLEFASQHFTITTLEGLAQLWEESPKPDNPSKPLLLFTFDDGRESNYTVAAPLLESFGGRGVFFVVPAFTERAATEDALSFYGTRMNPDAKSTGADTEDWKPMNPAQIADLARRGHAIGNHTFTHSRLVGLPPEILEHEIGDSARLLASWTNKPVDAFAWTFGWDAIDGNAWHAIQRHHRFCFSPCAGLIDPRYDRPSLLWRREIEVRYPAPEYRFCYSGLVDCFWRGPRERLRNMVQSSARANGK
jgi:peptidoglycan/xylan/chitin deacetylase (PgdA/CDA1 family)